MDALTPNLDRSRQPVVVPILKTVRTLLNTQADTSAPEVLHA